MKKILLLMAVLLTTAAAQAQLWWGYFSESDFDINKTTIGTGSVIPFMVGICCHHQRHADMDFVIAAKID